MSTARDTFLTAAEVAERLRCSVQLVYQAVAEGRLRCLRLSGTGKRGTIRIREQDLEEFLAECRVEKPDLD